MMMKSMRAPAPPSVALAGSLLGTGQVMQAELVLREVLRRRPQDAQAWQLLSVIANGSGRADEAISAARRAVELDEKSADARFALGRALKTAGRLDEAVAAYEQALGLRSGFADVHVSLGIALRLQGRLEEAAAHQREALRLRPDFPEALINLGNVLAERIGQQVGERLTAEDLREAEQVLRRALALRPGDANALHNLGIVLKLAGRYAEAGELFNRALAVDGNRLQTCRLFGELLVGESRFDLAQQLFTQWLRAHPGEPEVMLDLAACLAEQGDFDAALQWAERALEVDPASARARHQRARIAARTVRADLDPRQALAAFREAIEARPDYFEAVCSYLLTACYVEEDPQALAREHALRLAPVLAPLAGAAVPRFPPRGTGPLRVGYVSSDFRRHSVAYFLEGLWEARDRDRHQVVAYKSNAGGDAVTARLRGLADEWVEASEFSDEQLAARCRADDLDVVIDLAGLSSGGRLGVFQRRVGPCQLTWLGYPTTTGAKCFDYRLTDAWIDPLDAPPPASETPLRLAGGMFCYRPGPLPDVAAPPALARGEVTFGSFNNFSKAGPSSLRLWSAVLQAVPRSRLLLKSGVFMQHGNRIAVQAHFEAQGIAPERIAFAPWNPDVQDHFSTYHEVDIALDTTPYNGATTTCEALVMGVPVVSLRGATHPARMGASILSAAGFERWVAHDEAGYVERALALARDPARLAELRAGQREALLRSRLCDAPAFAREFERTLEAAAAATSGHRGDVLPA